MYFLMLIILICVIFIFSSLSKLSQLEVLNLNYNDFSEGLPSVIGELTRLKELNLDRCNIKDLPEG